MTADIIVRKKNTSRTKEIVTDEYGQKTKVIRTAENGRGDFILFINKEALTFRHNIVENAVDKVENGGKPGTGAKIAAIENQPVKEAKTQTLQQPHNELLDTFKIDNNNPNTVVEKSNVATPPLFASLRDGMDKLRNEEGRMPPGAESSGSAANENGGGSAKTVHQTIVRAMENMGKKDGKRDGKIRRESYLKKLQKDQQIGQKLPPRDEDYFAKLLFLQIQGSIYPNYGEDFLQSVEEPSVELLKLHMNRLELQPEVAFQTVSRAVQMVHRHLERHEDAYVYGILTWLRLDGEYKSGTLKVVVDEWIPKEQKRMQKTQGEINNLVK